MSGDTSKTGDENHRYGYLQVAHMKAFISFHAHVLNHSGKEPFLESELII